MSNENKKPNPARTDAARRRLRGFLIHLAAYFAIILGLMVINIVTDPSSPWFVIPMVGWGAVLAVHAAFAMGLFDVFRNR